MITDSEAQAAADRAEEGLDRFESLERRVSELEAKMSKIDQLQGRGAERGDSALDERIEKP